MERWMTSVMTDKPVREIKSHNVYYEGDTVYSYGRHFPLARALRDKKGTVHALLLNGDTVSMTTNGHQRSMRSIADGSGLPYAVIPQSVIEAAGIDVASIRILDALPERHTPILHREPEPPKNYYGHVTVYEHGDGKTYEWTTFRHWLGESLIEADIPNRWSRACKACERVGWVGHAGPQPVRNDHDLAVVLTDYGIMYQRNLYNELYREWLFSGTRCTECHGTGQLTGTTRRRRKFLSGFDRNEKRASYFFCEMPRTTARTVEDAYEALKPDTVRIAEQIGRPVARQGDIFAVAMSENINRRALTKMGAVYSKRGTLLGTNHVATETATLPDGRLLARGCLTHAPDFRAPDHARVKLDGKGWYLIVKNTVPLTA
jgi:hypothetical protein